MENGCFMLTEPNASIPNSLGDLEKKPVCIRFRSRGLALEFRALPQKPRFRAKIPPETQFILGCINMQAIFYFLKTVRKAIDTISKLLNGSFNTCNSTVIITISKAMSRHS